MAVIKFHKNCITFMAKQLGPICAYSYPSVMTPCSLIDGYKISNKQNDFFLFPSNANRSSSVTTRRPIWRCSPTGDHHTKLKSHIGIRRDAICFRLGELFITTEAIVRHLFASINRCMCKQN
jgi:hypothetical protein